MADNGYTVEELRHLRDGILDGALPVVFDGVYEEVLEDGSTRPIPIVQIDATDRLEVSDVFRVVRTEGVQHRTDKPIRSLYVDGKGYMEINSTFTDPVTVDFKFVLEWPIHRELFDLIEQEQVLAFTTETLSGGYYPDLKLLGLKMYGPEVLDSIAYWREMEDEG